MNTKAPRSRIRRRVIVATFSLASLALLGAATSDGAAVVGIIHPMQPIGNIDCCH